MAYTKPTLTEISQKLIADGVREVNLGQTDKSKLIDSSIKNNAYTGILVANAGAIYELHNAVEHQAKEMFISTAFETLEDKGATFGYKRKQSSKAYGYAIFTGNVGANIPLNLLLESADGYQFRTLESNDVNTQNINISSITRSGFIAKIVTASEHNLASGMVASIFGANQTDYNVSNSTVNVLDATSFTITLDTTPVSPATGTMKMQSTYAKIKIEAIDTGSSSNLANTSILSTLQTIIGLQSTVFIEYNGIQSGTDLEDIEVYRARLITSIQSNLPRTSAGGLKNFILGNVSGITRVWIFPCTPSLGSVTILFLRDGDTNPIPTTLQANDLKNFLLLEENGCFVSNVEASQVIVSPPTPVYIDITFTSLTPNTSAMQTAITQNIELFFANNTDLGQDVSLGILLNMIRGTVDANGKTPVFSISQASDILIDANEIAIKRNIVFPS